MKQSNNAVTPLRHCIDYLANQPEVTLDYPFGPDARVYKIAGKMFALVYRRNEQDCMNLKCDPEEAIQLRDVFSAVLPGYHMNKTHWNTVLLDGSLPNGELERMMDNSLQLVVAGLPKTVRMGLIARLGLG